MIIGIYLIGFFYSLGLMTSDDSFKSSIIIVKLLAMCILLFTWPFFLGALTYEVLKKL